MAPALPAARVRPSSAPAWRAMRCCRRKARCARLAYAAHAPASRTNDLRVRTLATASSAVAAASAAAAAAERDSALTRAPSRCDSIAATGATDRATRVSSGEVSDSTARAPTASTEARTPRAAAAHAPVTAAASAPRREPSSPVAEVSKKAASWRRMASKAAHRRRSPSVSAAVASVHDCVNAATHWPAYREPSQRSASGKAGARDDAPPVGETTTASNTRPKARGVARNTHAAASWAPSAVARVGHTGRETRHRLVNNDSGRARPGALRGAPPFLEGGGGRGGAAGGARAGATSASASDGDDGNGGGGASDSAVVAGGSATGGRAGSDGSESGRTAATGRGLSAGASPSFSVDAAPPPPRRARAAHAGNGGSVGSVKVAEEAASGARHRQRPPAGCSRLWPAAGAEPRTRDGCARRIAQCRRPNPWCATREERSICAARARLRTSSDHALALGGDTSGAEEGARQAHVLPRAGAWRGRPLLPSATRARRPRAWSRLALQRHGLAGGQRNLCGAARA